MKVSFKNQIVDVSFVEISTEKLCFFYILENYYTTQLVPNFCYLGYVSYVELPFWWMKVILDKFLIDSSLEISKNYTYPVNFLQLSFEIA